MKSISISLSGLSVCLGLLGANGALSQGTAFTYQGRLAANGTAANGSYDLKFVLYNSNSIAGTLVAGPVTNSATVVSNGLFSVTIDFGAVFDGNPRWLSMSVRTNGGGPFTALNSFQELTPAPYAIFANAASNLSGTLSTAQLTGTIPSAGLSGVYGNPVSLNNPNDIFTGSFSGNGAGLTNVWLTAGNGGTLAGPNFLGTTDNQPLELHVNGQRALRLEPNSGAGPNVVGGAANNSVTPGTVRATIAGGEINTVSGPGSTIGGGYNNKGGGIFAVIGGGYGNEVDGPEATVAGGNGNIAGPQGSTVAGGVSNHASGSGSFVGGGGFDGSGFAGNAASGAASVVGGGFANRATNSYATVVGGTNNLAGGVASVVGGGFGNQASGPGAVVGGGGFDGSFAVPNTASGTAATVGGGELNQSSGPGAFIGGGYNNSVGGIFAVAAGGYRNQANGPEATVGGGDSNVAGPQGSTVAGGVSNHASGSGSFVGGGGFDGSGFAGNTASGAASVVGGGFANQATNAYATVAGGSSNSAFGRFSLAAGQRAVARQDGTFVWADSQTNVFDPLGLSGPQGFANSFNVRSTAGFYIATGIDTANGQITSGVYVAGGGSGWNTLSDRNAKTHFSSLDATDMLRRLMAVPVLSWNYKSQDASVRHIGPMAQDFNAAFGVGEPDKSGERKYINSLDEEGVALAAIQGLNRRLEEKEARIKTQDDELRDLKARVEQLERLMRQR